MKRSGKDLDLTGVIFGKLTATAIAGKDGNGSITWHCKCECGSEGVWSWRHLTSGNTKSCGCIQRTRASTINRTHGMCRSTEYNTWCNMIARCENQHRPDYKHYGGRGISICERWRGSFECFLADMGKKPFPKASIDRKDHNGNYCPENCKWTTQRRQTRNCRDNHYITFQGRTQCLADWADEFGISARTIHSRLTRYGWSIEQAITLPKQHRWSHRQKRSETV